MMLDANDARKAMCAIMDFMDKGLRLTVLDAADVCFQLSIQMKYSQFGMSSEVFDAVDCDRERLYDLAIEAFLNNKHLREG
jgi:hypothetical protein